MLVKKIFGENFYRKKAIQIVKCSSSFVTFVNEKFFEYIIFVSIYAELITEMTLEIAWYFILHQTITKVPDVFVD